MFFSCPACSAKIDVSDQDISAETITLICQSCFISFTINQSIQDTETEYVAEQATLNLDQPETQQEFDWEEEFLEALVESDNKSVNVHKHRYILPWLSVGSTTLALIFVLQIIIGFKMQLSTLPLLQPLYQNVVCAFVPCDNQMFPYSLQLVDHQIAVHPNNEKWLLISAIIRNPENYEQRYPVIKLSLMNINNETIAERELSPSDYISAEEKFIEKLAANAMLPIIIEAVDPQQQWLSYHIEII